MGTEYCCAAWYDHAVSASAASQVDEWKVGCRQSTLLLRWPWRLCLHHKTRRSQRFGRSLQALKHRTLHSVRHRITDQRWTPREISLPLKGRGSNKHFSDSNLLLWNPRAKEITGSFATDFRGVRTSPLLIWKQVLSATGIQTQNLVMSHSGQTFSFKNR